MDIEYIIVQAGGKGSRMGYLTQNKPKALVAIDNMPMLFHIFHKYPKKKFIIIGDYKQEVLRNYLNVFAKIQYIVVDGSKNSGTCAGIETALEYIPAAAPFLLIWSDLVLADDFILPQNYDNYIGISKEFVCRWSYKEGAFYEEPSEEHGVAGFFIFKNKQELRGIPMAGELVRWLSQKHKTFTEIALKGTREFGVLKNYPNSQKRVCRPFNKMEFYKDKVVKTALDEVGENLAEKEIKWYQAVQDRGFRSIPFIYSYSPLKMEKIEGLNIFEYELNYSEKKAVLEKIVNSLKELHSLETVEPDYFSIKNNYIDKTFDRLNKVRDLIPFADNRYITINGTNCRNIFFEQDILTTFFENYKVDSFKLIHGDCTFSNILLNENGVPIFIDPRGYFGYTKLHGDANYDWAKLYYSIQGDYDQFNKKNFRLLILESGVTMEVKSNGWRELSDYFFSLLGQKVNKWDIQMIHAIIWLSLTTYVWEDYDSICGAFYQGLLYMEELRNGAME